MTDESAKPQCVLVIGWEEPLRRRIVWILREEGFDAFDASNLAAAIELARERRPDVVIINTDWPEHIKETQIDALQDVVPQTPIIDVTKRAVNPRYNTDADAYISKPFDATDLLDKINGLLDEEPGSNG
jgi:DNA-binding response OmpR family regulator